MPKKPNNKDALAELLAAAPHKVLSKLITELTVMFPDVRRECFDFLKSQSTVSKALAKRSEGEAILALWSELTPDLEELDMYGGGDYGTMDHVADLLDQIRERLESKEVAADHRRELMDLVLPFMKSGNAGMEDMLDDVAYAACYDDTDLRGLAQTFEAMEKAYKAGQARDIYRRLGDRNKYLELRGFVATRAQETGDRDKYMVLQSEQATDGLTFEKYQAFKKMCTSAEWTFFEAKVLESLKHAWKNERLKIRMHRREYDEALAILIKGRYPMSTWDGDYEIKVAKKLEKRYPEEILKYYLSGLGNINRNAQRKEYTRKAKVMVKVQHMLVDMLGDEARWEKFARKVKQDNHRRPAFQQEFADTVPGWSELN